MMLSDDDIIETDDDNYLVIDKAKWRNGRYYDDDKLIIDDGPGFKLDVAGITTLLSDNGLQCCLGLYGSYLGIPNAELNMKARPSNHVEDYSNLIGTDWDTTRLWSKILFKNDISKFTFGKGIDNVETYEDIFLIINDYIGIDDKIREAWVSAAFWYLLGVKVKIVGRYPTKITELDS